MWKNSASIAQSAFAFGSQHLNCIQNTLLGKTAYKNMYGLFIKKSPKTSFQKVEVGGYKATCFVLFVDVHFGSA